MTTPKRPTTSATRQQRRAAVRGDPVTRWAKRVVAGKVKAGPLVVKACFRHLTDLQHGHKRGLRWNIDAARRALEFFPRYLYLPEGKRARPFVLQPWQQFIVGSLFGWQRWSDEFERWVRRFTTAYIEIGKGNGKTPLAAGIALYMLIADREPAAEVYAAATQRDQAKKCWTDAERIVRRSKQLRARLLISSKAITHLNSASFFEPVSSEARGLDGKRVHCAIIDELQEHPTSLVVDKMRDGLKGRSQPLIVEITNSGFDKTTVCWQHHRKSEQVLTGVFDDDQWFAFVCGMDEDDDPLTDPRCWVKANPNIGVSVTRAYLAGQVREAQQMPARESGVRRVNFCQWVDAASPIFRGEDWQACQLEGFDLARLDGLECVAGLDLAGVNDLAALSLVFELASLGLDFTRGAEALVVPFFWTPADTLADREKRDNVPYSLWVKEGHLLTTPGRSINYAFIAHALAGFAARFRLLRLAFDPYRIKYLEQDLAAIGLDITMLPHGQGYGVSEGGLWMPRSVEVLEDMVGKRKLLVASNPVLTWNAQAAVLVADAKENRIFDKRKATGRIDGVVATAMALGTREVKPADPVAAFLADPIMVR